MMSDDLSLCGAPQLLAVIHPWHVFVSPMCACGAPTGRYFISRCGISYCEFSRVQALSSFKLVVKNLQCHQRFWVLLCFTSFAVAHWRDSQIGYVYMCICICVIEFSISLDMFS